LHNIVEVTEGYAPVNYDIAAKPHIEMINRRVWPTVVTGSTFTQGYKRYDFRYLSDSEIGFIPTTTSTKMKDSYCMIPTQNDMTPIHTLDPLLL
jgi:hypothetical protein